MATYCRLAVKESIRFIEPLVPGRKGQAHYRDNVLDVTGSDYCEVNSVQLLTEHTGFTNTNNGSIDGDSTRRKRINDCVCLRSRRRGQLLHFISGSGCIRSDRGISLHDTTEKWEPQHRARISHTYQHAF